MDVMELSLPSTVAVSKLLTSDDFSTIDEVEAPRPVTVSASVLVTPSITGCGSSLAQKDISCGVGAQEQNSASLNIKADAGLCRNESQLPTFQGDNIARSLYSTNASKSLFLLPKCAGKQLHRKGGKMSRSGSPCSKRLRTEQVEDRINHAGADDSNTIPEEFGSSLTKCNFIEKTRMIKQKQNIDGKRGDKRNYRAPVKNKLDSLFSKAGFLSSNSAAGGNNILGLHGLKSDIHDVTKYVDELSLNELLDGSYKCPNFCQDKGRKAANTNENLLLSVQKACSIIQRPIKSRVDLNSFSNRRTPMDLSSYCSCVTSIMDCEKGNDCFIAPSSCSKPKVCDSCSKARATAHSSDPLLYQPKDILERLALQPLKDLDSLLLDTAKHGASLRNTPDLCSSQAIPCRGKLPPFPWSHPLGGPYKISNDASKIPTNRSTCQSKWLRIGTTLISLGGAPGYISDLASVTYDQSLAPLGDVKLSISDNKNETSPIRLPLYEQASASVETCPTIFHIPSEAEDNLKAKGNGTILNGSLQNKLSSQENEDSCADKSQMRSDTCNKGRRSLPLKSVIGGHDQLLSWVDEEQSEMAGHSPRLLAAAQTLYEISDHSKKQNQVSGMTRWPKKPSQKVMKAHKSRSSIGKSEVTGSGVLTKVIDRSIPSKKLKVLTVDKKKEPGHSNNSGRGRIQWSVPTSSRSSPSKLERDSFSDMKQSNASGIGKLLGMMPSSTRMLDKDYSGQQKLRKPVAMDWIRGRSKKE